MPQNPQLQDGCFRCGKLQIGFPSSSKLAVHTVNGAVYRTQSRTSRATISRPCLSPLRRRGPLSRGTNWGDNRRSDDGQTIYFASSRCDRPGPCQHGLILDTRDSDEPGFGLFPSLRWRKEPGPGGQRWLGGRGFDNVAHPKVVRASDILPEAR